VTMGDKSVTTGKQPPVAAPHRNRHMGHARGPPHDGALRNREITPAAACPANLADTSTYTVSKLA
jgi:hypothetical protein